MLGDLKREKGLYAVQTQVGIYEAAPEEGASMTRTPLSEGPPPGICLQARNKVRQRYIVSEEQAGVAVDLRELPGKDLSTIPGRSSTSEDHPLNAGRRCQTPFGKTYYQSGRK